MKTITAGKFQMHCSDNVSDKTIIEVLRYQLECAHRIIDMHEKT